MKESDEYVIVYADTYFGQREEWNVLYTGSIICKKDDVEKAKKILVQEIINEDEELDISEIDCVVLPAVFL